MLPTFIGTVGEDAPAELAAVVGSTVPPELITSSLITLSFSLYKILNFRRK
jgi:hypothetical protein